MRAPERGVLQRWGKKRERRDRYSDASAAGSAALVKFFTKLLRPPFRFAHTPR
jgi:hypothetical protein